MSSKIRTQDKKKEIDIPVILPSLNPTEKLVETVDNLILLGFKDIIVINDGSSPSYNPIFQRIENYPQCTLLQHEINKGKGCALKTAFSFIQEHREVLGFVTADADGQHLAEDILKCALALKDDKTYILGARDFSKPQVPPRSVFGNRLTSLVFKISCKMDINDTQTGLRAFPAKYIPLLLTIKGERFEYETNMLLELQNRNIPFKEVSIETVYEDNNKGSHFHSFRDAFRIYKNIFKFMGGSILAFVLDNLIFLSLFYLLFKINEDVRILISIVIARLMSSFFNFTFNKKRVFEHSQNSKIALVRYYSLSLMLLVISWFILSLTDNLFTQTTPILLLLIKIGTESLLFILSFYLQKRWVFQSK